MSQDAFTAVGEGELPAPNRAARRRAQRRSKTLVAASLVAFSGLATGYLQMLRPTAAYASATCSVANESDLASCLTGLVTDSGSVTISLSRSVTLTGNLPRGYLTSQSVDLTIDGNGHEIIGAGNRAFKITASADDTLLVTDLTISGTSSDYGSAFYITGTPSFTLDDVTMTGTYATSYAGGVYS